MSVGFVDTSVLLTLAFNEADAPELRERLAGFDRLFASPLLEAEFRSACARERVTAPGLIDLVDLVVVPRPLTREIERVLAAGYLRGADCWHLATALYVDPRAAELHFLTRDQAQARVAGALGFAMRLA